MKIPRPIATVEASHDGKRFTVKLNHDRLDFEYELKADFGTRKKATSEANALSRAYDKLATKMETGKSASYHILGKLVASGIMKRQPKLDTSFYRFMKDAHTK
jgi:predicted transcriptional regulator